MVRKKILIGSILVLALILLMPSIPAVQQKTIDEGFKQEKLESINLDDLEEIEDFPFIKHPMLYFIVVCIGFSRFFRGVILDLFSTTLDLSGWTPRQVIVFPLIYARACWLFDTSYEWLQYWHELSDEHGWNW